MLSCYSILFDGVTRIQEILLVFFGDFGTENPPPRSSLTPGRGKVFFFLEGILLVDFFVWSIRQDCRDSLEYELRTLPPSTLLSFRKGTLRQ